MVVVRSRTAAHAAADSSALVAELAAGCGLAGALQARGLGGHRRITVVQAQRVAQGRRRGRCGDAAAGRAQRCAGDGEPQARRAGGDARHGAAGRRARRGASRWRRSAVGADLRAMKPGS